MNRESQIQNLVEDTLAGADNIKGAKCPDDLAERIKRMNRGKVISIWDKAFYIISRPMVAAACVVVVIVGDLLLLNDRSNFKSSSQVEITGGAGFASASAALLDTENILP